MSKRGDYEPIPKAPVVLGFTGGPDDLGRHSTHQLDGHRMRARQLLNLPLARPHVAHGGSSFREVDVMGWRFYRRFKPPPGVEAHRGASSRSEQSALPTLAGFVFVAENVASHDGPLSTACAECEAVFDNLTWRTRRGTGPFI